MDALTQASFDAYTHFLAVKRHFTTTYDFFKYNGKVKVSVDSFQKRRDRYFFYKLSKQSDWKDLVLSNVIADPKVWVGDLVDDPQRKAICLQWQKIKRSLTRHVCDQVRESGNSLRELLHVVEGEPPLIVRRYWAGKTSLETVTVLRDVMNVGSFWSKSVSDTILFPDINTTCEKYAPFLSIDHAKTIQHLRNTINTR